VYAWRIEPHWVEVVEREMPIANLPANLAGRRLVQISDLHLGPIVDPHYLVRAVEHLKLLSPDLIVITGDFMTYTHADQYDEVARLMDGLPQATIGCAAILGNHDYGMHWAQPDVAARLVRRLADVGVDVLRNQAKSFAGLNIIGIDDLWGTNFRPQQVLPDIDRTQANLVLCHNPDGVDLPVWSGYQGWILSGHTHGGQLKPPFLPPPILPVVNRRYTAGEFDLWDGRRLYINRGLGYSRRIRFNVRPEITCFTLTAAKTEPVSV
jgi:uncharacterized protein